jgi:16S rRNA (cytosine967-C5)-methyltransferase
LLDRAAKWVKPGGVLVYAVCSLEPEEGEAQISAFLERNGDYHIDAPRGDALPANIVPEASGMLRILPGMMEDQGGLDGFFVARLMRTG